MPRRGHLPLFDIVAERDNHYLQHPKTKVDRHRIAQKHSGYHDRTQMQFFAMTFDFSCSLRNNFLTLQCNPRIADIFISESVSLILKRKCGSFQCTRITNAYITCIGMLCRHVLCLLHILYRCGVLFIFVGATPNAYLQINEHLHTFFIYNHRIGDATVPIFC